MSTLVLTANAGDGTISVLELDGERFTPLATSRAGKGTGTFAIDADRDLVFAAHKAEGNAGPGIATLRLDRVTGELTPVAEREVESSMTYLSLTEDRRFLLGASYGGGDGAVWPVGDDGELGEPVARIEYPNLHCVVTEGDRAYFVSLGADLVAQYRIGEDGSLTPMEPAEVQLPEGVGARHLILDGGNAYVVTEYSGEIYRLLVGDDGVLSLSEDAPVSIVDPAVKLARSRFGADPRAEGLIWGADVHRAGGFLIGSERNASTLASVSLAADGALGGVVGFAKAPLQPRGFGVSPDGRDIVAVGERDTHAVLFRIGRDGKISRRADAPIGPGANWVRIIER